MDDTTPQKPAGPDPEGVPGQPGLPTEPTRSGAPEPAAEEPTRQVPAAEPTQPMAATPSIGSSGPAGPGAVPPGPGAVPPRPGAVPSGRGAVPPGPGAVPPAQAASVPPGPGQPVGWSPTAGPPVTPRRSIWRDAVSTTGGRIATITAIVAVAVIGLLVLGLVIGAITRHGRFERTVAPFQDHRSAPQLPRDRGPMGGMPGLRGNGGDDEAPGLGLGLGRLQHGEFTATDSTGKTRTLTFQRGEVTAASSTSMTVRSSDGFTATYKIDSSTRLRAQGSPLATGQTVVVLADKDTKTALRVQRGGVMG